MYVTKQDKPAMPVSSNKPKCWCL